jgi:hypothetical protein
VNDYPSVTFYLVERDPWTGEVWEALRACLASAERLAGIGAGAPHWELRDDNYIFAPLASAEKEGENNTAQDWTWERCLTTTQIPQIEPQLEKCPYLGS